MAYFLYALFFISCIVLVASVLLQPGKTDAGALFTSNVSSSAFAPRGTATVLSKITIIAAATFMMSALFLAMPALTGNISVLSANPDAPADTSNSNTNANTADANANTAAPADANATAPTDAPTADTNANAAAPAANSPADKPAANAPANAPAKTPAKK